MYIVLYDGGKLYVDKVEFISSNVLLCDDIYQVCITDIDRIEAA